MILDIAVDLDYEMPEPTDLILQIEAAFLPDQQVWNPGISMNATEHFNRIEGEDGIGERILLRTTGDYSCSYRARVEINRTEQAIEPLEFVPIHQLPSDAVRYLMPSRYCPSDQMQSFVAAEFGDSMGGERIAAMRDWINTRYQYVPGSSGPQTTAIDTFIQRQGVCRDFAHVLIALARASAIPARFVSVYAPYVDPQDFHAVVEVYLGGSWHLIDATGMARANQIVRIGVGQDAAEVPFLSSFGPAFLQTQTVNVNVVG